MTMLDSLPEHLVGHLFSLLPDDVSKKAFFSSSHIVRDSPCVLDQVTKLTVPTRQLCSGRDLNPSRCALAFPRAAQLKELVFKGTGTLPGGRQKLNDGRILMQVLRSQDEGMRAKLQQIQHFTLYNCRIKPDREAQLGAFLRSLPNLRALTIKEPLEARSHEALISFLTAEPVDSASLQELYCTMFDAPSVLAVSKLSSLESLTFERVDPSDTTPNILQPLSSLTALRHLSMKVVVDKEDNGLEAMLPHLQCLTSLKLDSLVSPSQLTAIPRSVRCLELEYFGVEVLCISLAATERGSGLPSFLHLRICDLMFPSIPQPNENQSYWRELGVRMASDLAALPSLHLDVGRVCSTSRLNPFLAFIDPVSGLAQKLTSIVIDPAGEIGVGTIPPTDLARLSAVCPDIEELSLIPDTDDHGIVIIEDLRKSLHEISSGFPRLSSFVFLVNVEEEPDYVSICVDFCVAFAMDQKRCGKVSSISVMILLTEDPFISEEDETDEYVDDMMTYVEDLKLAWAQANASLNGRACEVSLVVGRYN